MLNSVLLHFSGLRQEDPVIDLGVELARRSEAKIRGLTLIDTRRLNELLAATEAAVYATSELDRLDRVKTEHYGVRSQLTSACLAAGIDFDVRQVRGDPFEVLPPESQFHDLVVTAFPCPNDSSSANADLAAGDLIELVLRGVRPMLIVRGPSQPLHRVLLVSDGSSASARAVREFVSQGLFPTAELRLLAIGNSNVYARRTLREMVDYCRGRGLVFESGWLCGSPRRVLVPYACKWEADLVVYGVSRSSLVMRRLLARTTEKILQTSQLALYTTV